MSKVLNDRYEDTHSVSLLAEDQYKRELAWMEPLTDEEELKLLGRIARAKREPDNAWLAQLAKHARDRLVEAYQPLVISLARRYAGRLHALEFLDLVQEGNIGLLRAIDRCWDRGCTSFASYAAVCIRGAILQAYHDGNATFRVPSYVRVQINALKKAEGALRQVLGYEPSPAEIAKEMKVSEWDVLDLQTFLRRKKAESLQGMLREDDAEDRHTFVSLFQSMVDAESERGEVVRDRVQTALDALPTRQREVARLRYGFDGGLPLRTTHIFEGGVRLCSSYVIASELGISRSAASVTLCQGNKRLRQSLASLYEEEKVYASC